MPAPLRPHHDSAPTPWSYHYTVEKQYHPTYPASQWLSPYPEKPQPYPATAFSSHPRRYPAGLHEHPPFATHLEGPQGPQLGIGDLVAILGKTPRFQNWFRRYSQSI